MKNIFKLSTLFVVGAILFTLSCSDDPVVEPVPDPSGSWTLTSATLVSPDPLIVANLAAAGLPDAPIPAGAATVPIITALVGGALAAVGCADPANYGGFFLELTSAKKLIFHCPAESVADESGTWSILKDTDGKYTVFNLSVNLEGIPVPIQITVNDFAISSDGNSFTGTAAGYPMKNDLAFDLSAAGNAQFITTDMVFTKQ